MNKPTTPGFYGFAVNKQEILVLDRYKNWWIITLYGTMEPIEWCEEWYEVYPLKTVNTDVPVE